MKVCRRISSSTLLRIFILSFLAYGIFIRIAVYLDCRSIWLDEASLAVNVLDRSLSQILKGDLYYSHAVAPIGFLAITKLFVMAFGNSEYSLRFLPFICGMVSFLLFYIFLKKYASTEFSVLLAVILFSGSTTLLRYTTEFKPYIVDVFFSLIFILYTLRLFSVGMSIQNLSILALLGLIALWCSYTSLFILAGVGLTLLCRTLSRKEHKAVFYLLIVFMVWALFYLGIFCLSLHKVDTRIRQDYWRYAFMPYPISSLSSQLWIVDSIVSMFYYPAGFHQAFYAVILFVLGDIAIFIRNRFFFWTLISPIIFAMMAAVFHRYPFSGRLLLFYIPIVYFVIAEGMAYLFYKKSIFLKMIGCILFIIVMWFPFKVCHMHMRYYTVYREDIKPVLQYVKKHARSGDTIYIYNGAVEAFNYYRNLMGFGDEYQYIIGEGLEGNVDRFKQQISKLNKSRRLWIIFTHIAYDENGKGDDVYILDYLNKIGRKVDEVKAYRASGYLYNLSGCD